MKDKYSLFFCILFIILIGAALRIYGLDSKDLWHDEVIAIYRFEKVSFAYDPHPPLYYILLKFWITCFGKTEFAVRSLSVLAGIGSLLVLYKIGELLVSRKLGLISAFLLALSPLHIWYSQEARNYSLSVFLILVSIYAFLLCLKKDKTCLWAIFTVVTSLSIYTSYFAFFFIITEGLLFFVKEFRYLFKKWLLSICLAFIIFLPNLPIFIKRFLFIKETSFWVLKPTLKSIAFTFENFNIGYNGTLLMYLLSRVFFLFFLFGVIYLFYNKRSELFLLISFLFVPIASSFLISQFMPIYVDKQFMVSSLFYYIIIAQGLIILRPYFIKVFSWGIIFILIGFSLHNYYINNIPSPFEQHWGITGKKPFELIREYLEGKFSEGDIVAHANPHTILPLKHYYWNKDPNVHYYFMFPYALSNYRRNLFYDFLKHGYKTIIDLSQETGKELVRKFPRIWLITASWEIKGPMDKNSQEVKKWMDSEFKKITEEQFEGVLITFYKAK